MRTEIRPLYFLFLILGSIVVVPYLMTRPVQVTLAAAWRKCPALLWRPAVIVSVLLACLVTLPGTPLFVGLGGPIPLAGVQAYPLFLGHMLMINAVLIGMLVCLPVSAASTLHTYLVRKQANAEQLE